jgi:hypothetical protein
MTIAAIIFWNAREFVIAMNRNGKPVILSIYSVFFTKGVEIYDKKIGMPFFCYPIVVGLFRAHKISRLHGERQSGL